MRAKFDVVVVGGRVAGTSLAVHLRRRGLSVAIFDRADLPGDTISTHVIYPNTIARLERLGALDRIMAHRPPPLFTSWYHQNRMFVAPHTPEEGRDWALCIRRSTLDRHLQDIARESGVEVFDNAPVKALLGAGTDDDPVRGVVTEIGGKDFSIEAALVVGADGVSSTVAGLVGTKRERVMPTKSMLYYAYWVDVDTRNTQDFFFEPPWICAHFPADDGHHVVTMNGPVEMRRTIGDLEAFYLDRIRSIPQLWGRLSNARKVSDVRGTPRLEGFYRRQAGPGWLLSGDAAHFKHPASAQGIGDALHAAEALAPMIADNTFQEKYPLWREEVSRDLYAFCDFLADLPTDDGMRQAMDILIQDPVAARAVVDIWSRSIRPWDALRMVPPMLRAAGPSPEAVLEKYRWRPLAFVQSSSAA
jgi:2-polyprenyl-6-methoxyphenol hydroxylase-like FAD-dependent oxidoreductase